MARFTQFLNVPPSAITAGKQLSKSTLQIEPQIKAPLPGRTATPDPAEPFDGWDRVHWQRFEDKAKETESSPPTATTSFIQPASAPAPQSTPGLAPLPVLTADELNEPPVAIIPTKRKPFQKPSQRRAYTLSAYVSAEERKAIHLFCAKHKTTVAALVRQAVFERIGVDAEPSGPYKRKRGRPRKNPVIE